MSDVLIWWLACAARGTIALALIYVVVRLARGRLNPAAEHALWLAGLAAFVVPVGFTFEIERDVIVTSDVFTSMAQASTATGRAGGVAWDALIAAIWSMVVVGLLCQAGWAYAQVWRRVRRLAQPGPASSIAITARQLADELGVRRFTLALADDTDAFSIGLWRPMIVVPRDLSPAALRAVLAHELAHVARGDLWSGWFETIMRTLFFVSPMIYVASRRMSVARERCCDAAAVAQGGVAPTALAALLLERVAADTAMVRAPGAMPMAAHHASALAVRIRALLTISAARAATGAIPVRPRAGGAWAVAALILLGSSMRLSERDRYVASQDCIYTPTFAQNLLASYPEADADNDGRLSRNEACDWQAGWRKDGRGPVPSEKVAVLLNPQTLCCNCATTPPHTGEPSAGDAAQSSLPEAQAPQSLPATDILFVGRPTC